MNNPELPGFDWWCHECGRGAPLTAPFTCPACGGRGVRLSEACCGCAGHGLLRQLRRLRVRIPPGVDEGSVLRLKGMGDQGRGGAPPGDVQVRFQVRPSFRYLGLALAWGRIEVDGLQVV